MYDDKPEWLDYNGYIDVNVNVNQPYESIGFMDKKAFQEEYYRLFQQLKEKGIIRSATMKINREWVHD